MLNWWCITWPVGCKMLLQVFHYICATCWCVKDIILGGKIKGMESLKTTARNSIYPILLATCFSQSSDHHQVLNLQLRKRNWKERPFPPNGGNGSIAWTSAVSHVGRTSNAFKVTMKLQTFLIQVVVTSYISAQYLRKNGFAKSSDNLYTPCIYNSFVPQINFGACWFSITPGGKAFFFGQKRRVKLSLHFPFLLLWWSCYLQRAAKLQATIFLVFEKELGEWVKWNI